MSRINIAIAGGPGTGKSVLAAALFAKIKVLHCDYDLISEERRKLFNEMGEYRSPFERIYMWRQQEREELRSNAANGFITDTPLFHLYAQSIIYIKEQRDMLAIRELLRMCLELKSSDRYQIITIPQNPSDVDYKNDAVRRSNESDAHIKHDLIRSFVEHFWKDQLLIVEGSLDKKVDQIIDRLNHIRSA